MKKIKRSFAFIMAMLLTFVFGMTAFAATIEITNPVVGQTYAAYKIFDVSVNNGIYDYSIDSNVEPGKSWLSVVQAWANEENSGMTLTETAAGSGVFSVTFDNTKYNAADFAKHLNDNKGEKNPVVAPIECKTENPAVVIGADGSATGSLGKGYYFVTSTLGSVCMLDTAADKAEINEKNEEPTITKTVRNNEDVEADSRTATVGQNVTFTLKFKVGDNPTTVYTVHDTMTSGLTLINNFTVTDSNATVADPIANTDYRVYTAKDNADYFNGEHTDTFDIVFDTNYTSKLAKNDEITIVYEATVNANAAAAGTAINKVKLQFGNSYTPEDEAKVYTYSFGLAKTDSNKVIIDGAKFKLYSDASLADDKEIKLVKDAAGFYRPAVGDETSASVVIEAGNVEIKGLANGTYYLKETEAPKGYNAITDSISITITDANYPVTTEGNNYVSGGLQVVNNRGSEVPETGGMGTKIFYSLGAVMILGAGILLVSKRRMNSVK